MSDQLTAMVNHPDLRDAYAKETLVSLEAVLGELSCFGEVTLGAHDDNHPYIPEVEISWTATLRFRSSRQDPLMAHAAEPLLAALYCLMEALTETRRQARVAAAQFASEL
jgi:hypothetical protein